MGRGISYDFREGQVKAMRFDKIIRNGTLVLEHGTLNACLAIKGEKIAAILQDGCDVDADEVIDASGQYVFPGGIDTHTHFLTREPSTGKTGNAGQGQPPQGDIRW